MTTTSIEDADLAALESQIVEMANAQFDSTGYRRLLGLKFTRERARTYILQRAYWTTNRRDCWAHAQGAAPLDVKALIWEHEREELEGRPEEGIEDHHTLAIKEGALLGLTPEDFETTPPADGTIACTLAWLHLATHGHWLSAVAASAALELGNSEEILEGGSMSRRIGEKMNADLGIPLKSQPSNAEHMVADMEHGRLLMVVARNHARTPEAQEHILDGLRRSWALDRVWKGQLADMLEALPEDD
ncbi:MAG: iron-containing redox enzyme family protein [Alphaproteobacteria bacterium]|nr:iron-containing redox enzyme family protein [Alphaproteobacteria bacterium]